MGSIHGRVNGINDTFGHLQGASQNRRQALEQHLAQLLQIENLLLEFAQRGLAFRVWLENADDTLTDPITAETVEAVNDLQAVFNSFAEEKSQKEAEFHSLGELAANCKQLGVAETTYSEVSWASLQEGWNKIGGMAQNRNSELESEKVKQQHNEQLRVDFAHKAQAFSDWGKTKLQEIESLTGDLNAQLSSLSQITQQIAAGQAQFHEVGLLNKLLKMHVFLTTPTLNSLLKDSRVLGMPSMFSLERNNKFLRRNCWINLAQDCQQINFVNSENASNISTKTRTLSSPDLSLVLASNLSVRMSTSIKEESWTKSWRELMETKTEK